MGMASRNTFDDVAILREVHRYDDGSDEMTPSERAVYRKEAQEFLRVTRGMADCTWLPEDRAWLARRNRSALQQTKEGREQLKKFDAAPLLIWAEG